MGIIVNDGASKPIRVNAFSIEGLNTTTVQKHGEHDQSSHGSWSNSPGNGDDPSAMDMMDDKPFKLPRLTAAQRKIYNRVTSPASSAYVERPFGGVEFARTWGRKTGEPSVTGYVPFSGPSNA